MWACDALGLLVPDRPDREVALVDAEGRLGLGELDVGAPQLLGAPVGARWCAGRSCPRCAAPSRPTRAAPTSAGASRAGVGTASSTPGSGSAPRARVFRSSMPPDLALDGLRGRAACASARGGGPGFRAAPRSASRSARASPAPSPGDRPSGTAGRSPSPSGPGHSLASTPSRTVLPVAGLGDRAAPLLAARSWASRSGSGAPSPAATPGSPRSSSRGPSPRSGPPSRSAPPSSPRSPRPWSRRRGCRRRPRSPAASRRASPPARCTPACSPAGGRGCGRAGPAGCARPAPRSTCSSRRRAAGRSRARRARPSRFFRCCSIACLVRQQPIQRAVEPVVVDLLGGQAQQILQRRAAVPVLGDVQLARRLAQPREHQHRGHRRPRHLLPASRQQLLAQARRAAAPATASSPATRRRSERPRSSRMRSSRTGTAALRGSPAPRTARAAPRGP